MHQSRDEFLHRLNVTNYIRHLHAPHDEAQRATLLRLLAEEGAKAKASGWAILYP